MQLCLHTCNKEHSRFNPKICNYACTTATKSIQDGIRKSEFLYRYNNTHHSLQSMRKCGAVIQETIMNTCTPARNQNKQHSRWNPKICNYACTPATKSIQDLIRKSEFLYRYKSTNIILCSPWDNVEQLCKKQLWTLEHPQKNKNRHIQDGIRKSAHSTAKLHSGIEYMHLIELFIQV